MLIMFEILGHDSGGEPIVGHYGPSTKSRLLVTRVAPNGTRWVRVWLMSDRRMPLPNTIILQWKFFARNFVTIGMT